MSAFNLQTANSINTNVREALEDHELANKVKVTLEGKDAITIVLGSQVAVDKIRPTLPTLARRFSTGSFTTTFCASKDTEAFQKVEEELQKAAQQREKEAQVAWRRSRDRRKSPATVTSTPSATTGKRDRKKGKENKSPISAVLSSSTVARPKLQAGLVATAKKVAAATVERSKPASVTPKKQRPIVKAKTTQLILGCRLLTKELQSRSVDEKYTVIVDERLSTRANVVYRVGVLTPEDRTFFNLKTSTIADSSVTFSLESGSPVTEQNVKEAAIAFCAQYTAMPTHLAASKHKAHADQQCVELVKGCFETDGDVKIEEVGSKFRITSPSSYVFFGLTNEITQRLEIEKAELVDTLLSDAGKPQFQVVSREYAVNVLIKTTQVLFDSSYAVEN